MKDILFIAITVIFFLVSWLYVRGIYVYQLQTPGFQGSRRFVKLR